MKTTHNKTAKFVCLTTFVTLLMPSGIAKGANVRLFQDEISWQNEINFIGRNVSGSFEFNRENLVKSNEVITPPNNNQGLGSVLTFNVNETGLSRSFSLRANPNVQLVFNDTEGCSSEGAFCKNAISIGDINNQENDDFEVNILSGLSLFAFAFDLIDNHTNRGEKFSVFGQNNLLLREFTVEIPTSRNNKSRFVGIVSDTPIKHLLFDEDSGGDDIGINNFRFDEARPSRASRVPVPVAPLTAPVPEPTSALSLLAVGAFGGSSLLKHRLKRIV